MNRHNCYSLKLTKRMASMTGLLFVVVVANDGCVTKHRLVSLHVYN